MNKAYCVIILISAVLTACASEPTALPPIPTPPAVDSAPSKDASPKIEPPPAPAKPVPSKGGPGEAVLAYGKAHDEINFAKAAKYISDAELGKIRKPTLANLQIIRGLDNNTRMEAAKQLGIEESDLILPDNQLFEKVENANMKRDKSEAASQGMKWEFDFEFISEKSNGDNAVVVVKTSSGIEKEFPMIKENGAWKLASISEKESTPKKDEKSEPSLSPGEIVIRHLNCLKAGDAAGVVDLMSNDFIKNQALDFRRRSESGNISDFTKEDLKKDDKALLILYFSKQIAKVNKMDGTAKFAFKIEILDENIIGDTAIVKTKIIMEEGQEGSDHEIHFVKENGKWKINEWK